MRDYYINIDNSPQI